MNKYNSFMKSPHSAKLDAIQGLRALAVLLVIFYHYDFPVKNGFVGVDVFFVISGFVITQSLARNRTISWRKDLINFYVKRIARLFPAFFVVFLFTILAVFLVYSPNLGVQQNAIKGSLGAILGLSNFAIPRISGGYFAVNGLSNPFLHTWSLSLEEQFYIIYPLLFFFLRWMTKRKNSAVDQNLVLAFVILLSFSLTINLEPFSNISSIGTLTYFAPQARAWEFLLGAIVALNPLRENSRVKKKIKELNVLTISIIIVFSIAFQFNPDTSLFLIVIPVASAAIFLATNGSKPYDEIQSQKRKTLPVRILVHLGDLSYSLYLWHWPIYATALVVFPDHKFSVALFSIPITYVLSLITYKFVETRFNSSIISSKRFWVMTLVFGQLISVSLFSFMYLGVKKGWNQDWALNTHQVMMRGCDSGDIDFEKCYWGDEKATKTIYVVGDSFSWAFADSVIEVSLKEKFGVQTFVKNGCSITEQINYADDPCSAWRKRVVKILSDNDPDLVIIANSNGYIEQDLLGMGDLIRKLNREATKVLFVLPPGGGDSYSGRRALAFRPGNENRSTQILPAINMAAYGLSKYENKNFFAIYDPTKVLCTTSCISAKNGKDFYIYEGHLSVYANRILEPSIKKVIFGLIRN